MTRCLIESHSRTPAEIHKLSPDAGKQQQQQQQKTTNSNYKKDCVILEDLLSPRIVYFIVLIIFTHSATLYSSLLGYFLFIMP